MVVGDHHKTITVLLVRFVIRQWCSVRRTIWRAADLETLELGRDASFGEETPRPGSPIGVSLLLYRIYQESSLLHTILNLPTNKPKVRKQTEKSVTANAGREEADLDRMVCLAHGLLAPHACLEPLSGAELDGFSGTRGGYGEERCEEERRLARQEPWTAKRWPSRVRERERERELFAPPIRWPVNR